MALPRERFIVVLFIFCEHLGRFLLDYSNDSVMKTNFNLGKENLGKLMLHFGLDPWRRTRTGAQSDTIGVVLNHTSRKGWCCVADANAGSGAFGNYFVEERHRLFSNYSWNWSLFIQPLIVSDIFYGSTTVHLTTLFTETNINYLLLNKYYGTIYMYEIRMVAGLLTHCWNSATSLDSEMIS